MSGNKQTLGQSIDNIINSLEPLDESARKVALTAVCMQLNLSIGEIQGSSGAFVEEERLPTRMPGHDPESKPAAPNTSKSRKTVDIRTFKEEKSPSSARQMACVVAFYLQELAPEAEQKDTVNAQDLEKYFKQAKFKLPSRLGQVLADAKAAGYFDAATRGEYKLNAVGYNLVAHNLPRGDD